MPKIVVTNKFDHYEASSIDFFDEFSASGATPAEAIGALVLSSAGRLGLEISHVDMYGGRTSSGCDVLDDSERHQCGRPVEWEVEWSDRSLYCCARTECIRSAMRSHDFDNSGDCGRQYWRSKERSFDRKEGEPGPNGELPLEKPQTEGSRAG